MEDIDQHHLTIIYYWKEPHTSGKLVEIFLDKHQLTMVGFELGCLQQFKFYTTKARPLLNILYNIIS